VGRALQELHRIDPAAAPLLALHEQSAGTLRDLQSALSRYADRVDIDPERLRQLEGRLDLLHSLKRKYGATLAGVIACGEEARQKLRQLERREAELERIQQRLKENEGELERAGQALSARRRRLVPQLNEAVRKQLSGLGFRQSRFDAALASESRISSFKSQIPLSGLDTVEFQFTPNPGEPSRPLRAIASSGELARVMLALKTVLAAEDEIPLLVFDEVDANIGGETANAVGEKMKQIAARRQVLCITHLPQVAAPASAHYVVTKHVGNGRTVSGIRLLDPAERVTELTRMLGGQTPAARKHAESLLG
jgi:DNA repair protein RecN (Recombination protein N)